MEVWPQEIRLMLRENKERELVNGFEEDSVFAGPPYIDDITDDTPSIFTGTLVLDRRMAQRLYTFFLAINKGRDRFMMPIYGEFGLFMQECQARPSCFRAYREVAQDIFEYNIEVIVPEYKPFGEDNDYLLGFIDIGWEYPQDFNIFDTIVNENFPEV